MDMISLKNKKRLGLAILILTGCVVIRECLFAIFSYHYHIFNIVLLAASGCCVGISLFRNIKNFRILYAVGLWIYVIYVFCNLRLGYFQFWNPIKMDFLLYTIPCLILIYIGFISLTNFKYAKLGCILSLIIITIELFSLYVLDPILWDQFSWVDFLGKDFYYNLLRICEIWGHDYLLLAIQISFLLICMSRIDKKPKEEQSTIGNATINTEIIDFKTLLLFIENQYKNNEITEEEYRKKRAEILKQL